MKKKKIKIAAPVFFIFCFLMVSSAWAEDQFKSIYINRKVGTVTDAVISGSLLYLASDKGLACFDISDPMRPKMKQFLPSDMMLNDIVIEGRYAYATYGKRWFPGGKLKIYDISGPKIEEIPNDLLFPEGPIGLVVQKGIAYVADYASGLMIVDVKDPRKPEILSTYCDQPPYDPVVYEKLLTLLKDDPTAFKKMLKEKFPWIALTSARMDVWIQKVGPTLIAQHAATILTNGHEGHLWWVTVRYPYAFMPFDGEGLRILDISDPCHPVLVSKYNKKTADGKPFFFNSVALSGDYAYVAVDYMGLLVLDISDIRRPREVNHIKPWTGYGWYESPGHMVLTDIRDHILYISTAEDGMYLYDIQDPVKPQLVSKLDGSVPLKKGMLWGFTVEKPYLVTCYFSTCNTGACNSKKLTGGFEIYKRADPREAPTAAQPVLKKRRP